MRNVVLMFGIQGSGKGTQAERIKEKYNFTDITVGNLLREKAKTDKRIRDIQKSGKLVPDADVEKVIEEKIETLNESEGILFDGFPRSASQLEIYKKLAKKYDFRAKAISIDISEDEALKRISTRYVCPKCGYIAIGKGKCPCGGELVKREDDTDEAGVRQRIGIFKRDTKPTLDYFEGKGELIRIDGMGTMDEVTARILKSVQDFYKVLAKV